MTLKAGVSVGMSSNLLPTNWDFFKPTKLSPVFAETGAKYQISGFSCVEENLL